MQSAPSFAEQVRTTQIIAVSLVLGPLFFLGVVIFRRQAVPAPAQAGGDLPLLTLLAFGLAAVCLVARYLMAWQLAGKLASAPAREANETSNERLAGVYQTSLIISMALIEGAAFFTVVAYMNEGHVAALALAIGLLAVMILHFPTTGRIESWIKRQRENIEMQRGRNP